MDKTWQLQEAKTHFSEVVDRASKGEPQIVTKHGQNAVAIISFEAYTAWRAEQTTLLEALVPDQGVLEEDEANRLFARQTSPPRPVRFK